MNEIADSSWGGKTEGKSKGNQEEEYVWMYLYPGQEAQIWKHEIDNQKKGKGKASYGKRKGESVWKGGEDYGVGREARVWLQQNKGKFGEAKNTGGSSSSGSNDAVHTLIEVQKEEEKRQKLEKTLSELIRKREEEESRRQMERTSVEWNNDEQDYVYVRGGIIIGKRGT